MSLSEATIPAYGALALQATCTAVNGINDRNEARQTMLKTIEHIGCLLMGSKGFIQSFSGVSTRLVVLPEYFLTGFPLGEDIPTWSEKACLDHDGPEYEALGRLAQKAGVYLSGNAYELDDHFKGLYFQTSFIIAPNGDVVLRYRRLVSMYAPTPHDVLDKYLDIYGEDSLFPVLDCELGRLACVASEEILFPEITRALALRGAEVICHSSSEVGSTRTTPKNVAKLARAYENMVYVVSANSAGITDVPFPMASTDAHSQVVDFHGHVLAEAGTGESMVGNAEIDIHSLRQARRRPAMTNTLARQRLELFGRVYGDQSVYPVNNMMREGEVFVPERQHFTDTIGKSIDLLAKRGVI
jgi:predicted amidohydrolase